MTVEELKAVLVSMGVDGALVVPDALREEAGLDSLGVAELALVMSRERGVPVSEEELHATVTLADVAALLSRATVRAAVEPVKAGRTEGDAA